MRLWKRASGALKDQNSLWRAHLSRHTALRHPDIEKAVIRATSHGGGGDPRAPARVLDWLRLSPLNLKPVLFSLSNRVERTRDWSVALKGLHLTHTIIASKLPCVKKIGRLPFDLSDFHDAHGRPARSWPFDAFVRAYYAFLDLKSALVYQQAADDRSSGLSSSKGVSIKQELSMLQKMQTSVDLLMQIRPQARAAFVPLVLHVMDAVIIEIYDFYSKICRGIAVVLMNIYSGEKNEAMMALDVVKKATRQGEDLTSYFEFCQEIGVVNAAEFPVIDRIPDEGIRELEQIIRGFEDNKLSGDDRSEHNEERATVVVREDEMMMMMNNNNDNNGFRTIITDDWERFDEDHLGSKNPFASPLVIDVQGSKKQEPPDLISFL